MVTLQNYPLNLKKIFWTVEEKPKVKNHLHLPCTPFFSHSGLKKRLLPLKKLIGKISFDGETQSENLVHPPPHDFLLQFPPTFESFHFPLFTNCKCKSSSFQTRYNTIININHLFPSIKLIFPIYTQNRYLDKITILLIIRRKTECDNSFSLTRILWTCCGC